MSSCAIASPCGSRRASSTESSRAEGGCDVRAAPGVIPVLEIEMAGTKPFLATGSSVPLSLTGLDLRVRYTGKQPGIDPKSRR